MKKISNILLGFIIPIILSYNSYIISPQTLYISPNGNDNGSCTQEAPCATFAYAQQKAISGDTIFFENGVYPAVVITKSGIILDTDYARIISNTYTGILIGADNVTVRSFDVSGGRNYGIYVDKKNFLIENNIVHNSVTGNNTSENECGVVSKGWGSAIKVRVGGQNGVIRDNFIHSNCGEGIAVTRGKEILIEYNSMVDNYSVNIYIDNSSDVAVINNSSNCLGGYKRNGYNPYGIALGAEFYRGWGYNLHNIFVSENASSGCKAAFVVFPANVSGILENLIVSGNIFSVAEIRGISLDNKHNKNVLIKNNLVFNDIWIRNRSGVISENNTVYKP